jgi:predicted RND superfamily exporter protein
MLKTIYQNFILKYPTTILTLLLIGVFSFGYYATKLEIDASADTLLLENDPTLKLSREMSQRFTDSSMLIITYAPKSEMLSPQSIETLNSLSKELTKLPLVKSVDSILTVPLLLSPPAPISELINDVKTLSDADKHLAKEEFLRNPLYKGNLVSTDFKTSAIILNLHKDLTYAQLRQKKELLERKSNRNQQEEKSLRQTLEAFKKHRDEQRILEHKNIEDIRAIIAKHQSKATLFLGGVHMIANDIVGFVKSDLVIYGSTLVAILLLVLWFVFGQLRWVLLPLLISILSVLSITSTLGFFGWEITVISSNFIALQLIITLSIVLHLIVHYNEMLLKYPKAKSKKIILLTVLHKATPTFFAIITTIAGFSSLIISNIKPIINLGWMMSAGIALSLLISFIVFPTVLMLLHKGEPKKKKECSTEKLCSFTQYCLNIVLQDKKGIFISTSLVLLFSLSGASKLIVENSFINYFKQDTEIYKGMKIIDEELGGTTPLDIILTFKQEQTTLAAKSEEEDEFEDEFMETQNDAQYWFTKEKMDKILEVHDYLDSIEEIGTVQSLASILKIGKELNNNKELDGLALGLLYTHLPEKYKSLILSPYINIEHNQVRFSTRVVDSNEALRRDELLRKIQKDLDKMISPEVGAFKLSNLMVLYNNMLQSLFDSQISTLGFVLAIIFFMFIFLFRSVYVALIAIGVNIVPIGLIFGFMGWFGIPLDIMTITIAAIAIGIGVDDTIHYIHRFKEEYDHSQDYTMAVQASANSIGHAMEYTSVTIMLGFSILVLSNLIPTIYFGLLTMLVMGAALLANIILLPKVLMLFKPFTSKS